MNDSGVWNSSDLRRKTEDNCLIIPGPTPLPLRYIRIPYLFVGGDVFAVKSYIMKPYPQINLTPERVYNYHHSPARRISENLFGIAANTWRFQQLLNLSPEKARTITKCALVLYNILRKSLNKNDYIPPGFVDSVNLQGELVQGSWRSKKGNSLGVFSSSIVSQVGRKGPKDAKIIREIFTEYFMNEGSVRRIAAGQDMNRQRNFWTIFIYYYFWIVFLELLNKNIKLEILNAMLATSRHMFRAVVVVAEPDFHSLRKAELEHCALSEWAANERNAD